MVDFDAFTGKKFEADFVTFALQFLSYLISETNICPSSTFFWNYIYMNFLNIYYLNFHCKIYEYAEKFEYFIIIIVKLLRKINSLTDCLARTYCRRENCQRHVWIVELRWKFIRIGIHVIRIPHSIRLAFHSTRWRFNKSFHWIPRVSSINEV